MDLVVTFFCGHDEKMLHHMVFNFKNNGKQIIQNQIRTFLKCYNIKGYEETTPLNDTSYFL